MSYYVDLKKISLTDFKEILLKNKLLPSQTPLKNELEEKFAVLQSHNIENLSDLQAKLKTKDKVNLFSEESGLPEDYLILLRREVNSYHPKAVNLKDFPGINEETVAKLKQIGIKNTVQLFDKVVTKKNREDLAAQTGININEILDLTRLTDVSRLKYVGPAFARLLIESNYDSAERVIKADFEQFYNNLQSVNENNKFYRGHLGLDDLRRWIEMSDYLPIVISY